MVVLLAILAWVGHSRADAISDCFDSLAFDECTLLDPSGVCQERFQQDEFANATYSQQLFKELIELFLLSPTLNTSASNLLPMLLSPSDTTYASYLDTTYGTACSTDSGIAAILNSSLTEPSAQMSRTWLLLLMRQANFCTDNEMFVIGQGCVCKEDKDCNDGTGSAHVELIKRMAAMVLVLALWVGWGIYTNHRQANAIGTQQDTVIQTSNMLYAQSVSDASTLVKLHTPSAADERKSRASPPPQQATQSQRPQPQQSPSGAVPRPRVPKPTVAVTQQTRPQGEWTS